MAKKVILNLRQSTERIGGAEVVIRRTVGAMDKNKYEIIVVCLKKPGMDLSAIKALLADAGATYLELESKALLDLRALRQILALIRKYKPDVVHCHDAKTDFLGFLLRWLKPGLPLVTTMHGWVVASKKGAWYKRLDEFFLRFFHRAIAVSPLILEQARAKRIRRSMLIENGIPVREWRQRLKEDLARPFQKENGTFHVGFLGRICKEKGPLEFLETAAIIGKECPRARFVVAGEGPLFDEMQATAKRLGIAEQCRFLGQLQLSEVPGFLTDLDVLLSTSETEGIPNALLEAATMGIPIVASAVGGVPRVVADGETGFLAPYAARKELAEGVCKLLKDAQLHQQMSDAGVQRMIDQFSISITAEKLAGVYDELS